MDDPIIGAVAPIRLRRSCERNRLERQFLINAYEHLALVTSEQDDVTDDDAVPEEESSEEHGHAREACVAYC